MWRDEEKNLVVTPEQCFFLAPCSTLRNGTIMKSVPEPKCSWLIAFKVKGLQGGLCFTAVLVLIFTSLCW